MIRHLFKLVWNRKRENGIVIAEIFLSFLVLFFVLVVGGTYLANWKKPLGFDYHNVLVLRSDIDFGLVASKDVAVRDTMERVMAEIRSFPEVESVAASSTPPYTRSTSSTNQTINGVEHEIIIDEVTDDFARTMNVQLVRGRWFNREDDAARFSPFVVDETAARSLFGDADPIGKTFEFVEKSPGTIVGVVKSYRKDGETMLPPNMMFRRAMRNHDGEIPMNIVVRLQPGVSAAFEEPLMQRIHAVAPDITFEPRSLERLRQQELRVQLMPLIMGGIVSFFLVAMVTLGLTGVLWQNVIKRTREIGLRRAIGASSAHIHRQVLSEVVLLASVAVLIGTIIVLQLPALGLFSIVAEPAFAAGLAGALATIYGLTVLCGLYPSWLASRLQPADALRYE